MFHAFDVVTNTKGDSLPGFQVLVRDPTTSAVIPIFADDNGTPISTVSSLIDIALTDGAGNYSFFVPFGSYNLEYRTPDGVSAKTIKNVPFNSGSQGKDGDPGPADNTYTSYAALLASDKSRKSARLVGDTDTPAQPDGDFRIVGNAWVRQATTGLTHTPKGQSSPMLSKGFLDRLGNWAEDGTGIQQAADLIKASGNRQLLRLPPERMIDLATGITLDVSFALLDANNATLRYTGTTGAAVTMMGSASPPYSQATNRQDRLRIVGPGQGTDTQALLIAQPNVGQEDGPSHVPVEINASGFGTGVRFGHNAYLNRLTADIWGCGTGVDVLGSTANATENLRVEGALFNNLLAIRMRDQSGSGTLFLDGMSLDYNLKLIAFESRGQVIANKCWHETAPYTQRPITFAPGPDGLVDGAGLIWDGGRMLLSAAATDPAFDYWAEVPAGAYCHLRPDFAIRCRTATGIALAGAGESSFRFRSSFDAHGNSIVTHPTRGGMLDGDMANANVVDWFVVADDRTSEIASPNLTLSKVTDVKLDGAARSLKATKSSGSGSMALFAGIRPVQAGDLIGRRLFWRKPGGATGTVFVSMRFGTIGYDADGRRKLQYADAIAGDVPVMLPSADSGWQLIEVPGANLSANRVPAGATHAIILVNAANMSAGDFHIGLAWQGEIG